MSQQPPTQREVSESAFEYLIAEILAMKIPDRLNTEQIDENLYHQQRLDNIGYEIGYRHIEQIAEDQKVLDTAPLDIMKFICKDFWEALFHKKIDKLQTNHRGVFVLSDYNFKWLERYASDDMNAKTAAVRLLHLPCGIVRGALANLGYSSIVNADFNTLPSCTFNIRIKNV